MSDFLSLADLTPDTLCDWLDLADNLKAQLKRGEDHRILMGQTLAMIFEKPSLRTRVTFEVGMFQLGGYGVLLETRLGERESVPDVARNLNRWTDGIIARTFSHDHVVELAEHAEIPVINALTDKFHPCQILADVQAVREHRGKNLGGMKVAFVGDGNNVFQSWVNFAVHVPIELVLVCPPGYQAAPEVIDPAAQATGGRVRTTHDIDDGVCNADVVYTDVWASMGQESEAGKRRRIFQPYQVNEEMMARAKRDALFMHCLPAHRGDEVTAGVIDGPNSIVFDQAENRLHAQKAVLVKLMSDTAR
ncbi:MAG: ornithine carbamoyltransferase [Candidatus Hydrogenedentota bacterium]